MKFESIEVGPVVCNYCARQLFDSKSHEITRSLKADKYVFVCMNGHSYSIRRKGLLQVLGKDEWEFKSEAIANCIEVD